MWEDGGEFSRLLPDFGLHYSIFGIAVDRKLTLKRLFPQEKATLQCSQKDYVNSENALELDPQRQLNHARTAAAQARIALSHIRRLAELAKGA